MPNRFRLKVVFPQWPAPSVLESRLQPARRSPERRESVDRDEADGLTALFADGMATPSIDDAGQSERN